MKRSFLLLLAVVTGAFLVTYTSCKKEIHPTNPTSENYRLLAYTTVITTNMVAPAVPVQLVTENYRFEYDGNKRVSRIYFTSNDSNKVKAGRALTRMDFSYVADSIFKKTTDLSTNQVMEKDTFILNIYGQIKDAYFPNEVHNFTYFGALLGSEIVTYRDTNTTLTGRLTYTSDAADLHYRFFDGNIAVKFPDSAVVPYIAPPPYKYRDTGVILPITVTYGVTTPGLVPTSTTKVVNGYTDQIGGFFEDKITVNAVDFDGNIFRTGYWPAGYSAKQFYDFYDYLADRPCDYLQLGSFTTYGVNIYQNKHMIASITSSYNKTNISYTIDADSKVTNETVIVKDSTLKNTVTQNIKFQYEYH